MERTEESREQEGWGKKRQDQNNKTRHDHSQRNPQYIRPAHPSRPIHQSSQSDSRVPMQAKETSRPRPRWNNLEIKLSFKDREDWAGEAVLDTGARDNWMSVELSKELHLAQKKHPAESFLGFQGALAQSSSTVEGSWHYGHRTYKLVFRLMAKAPFDVLLGYNQLTKVGLVDFEASVKNHLEPVLTLAKDKKKESKGRKVHTSEQRVTDRVNRTAARQSSSRDQCSEEHGGGYSLRSAGC